MTIPLQRCCVLTWLWTVSSGTHQSTAEEDPIDPRELEASSETERLKTIPLPFFLTLCWLCSSVRVYLHFGQLIRWNGKKGRPDLRKGQIKAGWKSINKWWTDKNLQLETSIFIKFGMNGLVKRKLRGKVNKRPVCRTLVSLPNPQARRNEKNPKKQGPFPPFSPCGGHSLKEQTW